MMIPPGLEKITVPPVSLVPSDAILDPAEHGAVEADRGVGEDPVEDDEIGDCWGRW